ncbi:hypothetical protein SXCC_03649 [Gluconacetobacter sp. SXCC-1]|nr:hypothetical protein SXCC_03649 [Gluconacetobacter sp. SXCC-1]
MAGGQTVLDTDDDRRFGVFFYACGLACADIRRTGRRLRGMVCHPVMGDDGYSHRLKIWTSCSMRACSLSGMGVSAMKRRA